MKRSGASSSMTIGGGVSGNGVGDGPSGASGSLNMDGQVRELKLGSTFNARNTTTAFHTIKYDFKPASVDFNKVATFNIESNNQVTVTVPNVEGSGVPNTVYQGVQRKYTKECLLIIDRDTGVVTLEKLNDNIMVKKTRKGQSGPARGPLPSLENSTKRISSKTKVSTGSRKTNSNIISAPQRSATNTAPTVMSMSPLQSTLGISGNTRSPIQAPEWKANAAPSTLPSVPMLLDDDDDAMMSYPPQNLFANNQRHSQSQSPGSSSKTVQPPQQQMKQASPQLPNTFSNNFSNSSNSSIFGAGANGASHLPVNGTTTTPPPTIPTMNNLGEDIGILSSSSSSGSDSESSSDSDSSDSDSDTEQPQATGMSMPSVPMQQKMVFHNGGCWFCW
uniref:Ell-associated factor Eaf n=1 Tax=Megaselia scalaris TaxID=36166 RepID=T1GAV4_MEGSC